MREHVYKRDNLLIYYWNCSNPSNFRKLSLEKKQKQMSSFNDVITNIIIDSSKIITVNNIRFFILESHLEENWSIQFISDYDKNDRYINGLIEFKKTDETKAVQYLQELLQNMHLKK